MAREALGGRTNIVHRGCAEIHQSQAVCSRANRETGPTCYIMRRESFYARPGRQGVPKMKTAITHTESLRLELEHAVLHGDLSVPEGATGLILFAHGSGSSRLSPRNRYVASVLNNSGFATLLFDLLTPEEEEHDTVTAHYRFNIPLLAGRMARATEWVAHYERTRQLALAYFGASTGAAAALVASATRTDIAAIVSRGGRPDLAGEALPQVHAPTLLIVGGNDFEVIRLNQEAMRAMTAHCELKLVPGATHLFEEPGALDQVTHLAADWFNIYLK